MLSVYHVTLYPQTSDHILLCQPWPWVDAPPALPPTLVLVLFNLKK